MNIRSTRLLTLLILLPFLGKSQSAIEPYIGYSIPVTNGGPFSQINLGLQYPIISKQKYQMVLGLRGGFSPWKLKGADVAYTSDPLLPLTVNAVYNKQVYSAAFTFGNRFKIASWASDKNMIFIFLNVGFLHQSVKIAHRNYDKEEYTILNPLTSFKKDGLFLGAGLQYKRKINIGYVFFLADISSASFTGTQTNRSYETPGILVMNAGYIVEFKKRNK